MFCVLQKRKSFRLGRAWGWDSKFLGELSLCCNNLSTVNKHYIRVTLFKRKHCITVWVTFINDGVNPSGSPELSKPPCRRRVLDFRVLKPRFGIITEEKKKRKRLIFDDYQLEKTLIMSNEVACLLCDNWIIKYCTLYMANIWDLYIMFGEVTCSA